MHFFLNSGKNSDLVDWENNTSLIPPPAPRLPLSNGPHNLCTKENRPFMHKHPVIKTQCVPPPKKKQTNKKQYLFLYRGKELRGITGDY